MVLVQVAFQPARIHAGMLLRLPGVMRCVVRVHGVYPSFMLTKPSAADSGAVRRLFGSDGNKRAAV